MTGGLVKRDIAEFFPPGQQALFQDCLLRAPPGVMDRVSLLAPPVPALRKGCRVTITRPDFAGRIKLSLGPGEAHIRIETCGPANLDIRTWRKCNLTISKGTTINQARIVCDDADILVGEDGLWSDEILIQSNDQHGIVDLETMALCNPGRRRIVIHDHVWIGRRTTIMPDVEIGKGGILATGAVLTSDMPENTIFAGVPARQIRKNVSWSRAPGGFSEMEKQIMGLLP